MRCLKTYRWLAAFTLAIALAPSVASAQVADTLNISGTFQMDSLQGIVGADLAAVFANRNDHSWTLTLYGVTYAHDYSFNEWFDELGNYFSDERYFTNVYAMSFDFRFTGPDADVLNEVVSSQLVGPSLTYGPLLTLFNGNYYDSTDPLGSGPYARWALVLLPVEPAAGVVFSAGEWRQSHFSADELGYPLVEPQRVSSYPTEISDRRPGNSGSLVSYNDIVDIGSSVPPYFPPTMRIADASVPEGDRGTRRLDLIVTLSAISGNVVTVNYATTNGSALAGKDYTATSGILTFQPGETSRAIIISIKADSKREPDEAFSVLLSNATGATIADSRGSAVILNDD